MCDIALANQKILREGVIFNSSIVTKSAREKYNNGDRTAGFP